MISLGLLCGFVALYFTLLLRWLCYNALLDCDAAADEMPELSDGDDDVDDDEQWQWMDDADTEQVNVPCPYCDRWDNSTIVNIVLLHMICFCIVMYIIVYC